jgi:hypothetical protein
MHQFSGFFTSFGNHDAMRNRSLFPLLTFVAMLAPLSVKADEHFQIRVQLGVKEIEEQVVQSISYRRAIHNRPPPSITRVTGGGCHPVTS